jgi:RHH-type proline utilization regulon transcriptional repressor/proline dehydrogenase/delta 1-pyrroline-5-carboxylate dehydrogenase
MINEQDTDFDRECNQEWQRDIFKKWKKSPADKPDVLPTQIGAETVVNDSRYKYYDRSQEEEVEICEMSRANAAQVEQIVKIAAADPGRWRDTTIEERHKIMYDAANRLGDMRGDLIGCMCAITGKTVTEGDVEVSEGIDYCRFYTTSMKKFYALDDVDIKAKGTVLVISPWNFPCAIPCGGVVAGLASGNTVILKPASVAAPVAWLFAKAFWDAGVPKEALPVVITDHDALPKLTQAPEIKHIILTGGTDTAQQILRAKPTTPLSAETGGKNVIILTASADMDHGIMCACHSAFGNAGQKCSACSLLLVERSVYNRPDFREKLRDCATSLKVGGVWDAGNIVGPMITNHNEKLLKAIETLEPGEEWLVPPRFVDKNHYILAPTVKMGVRPDNYSFRTELFGPVLSVAPFDTLDEAIDLVNGLDYGLTSGIQTLDEKERRKWRDSIMAGNLYINRGITGAIVNRQPFGGMKLSAFGPGIKAGGPNYCQQFTVITDKPGSTTKYEISYRRAWVTEFSRPRDWNKCSGEQNVFRYLPLAGGMALRLFKNDTDEQAVMIATAAQICGTPLTVSFDPGDKRPKLVERLQRLCARVKTESLDAFIESMPGYERIRTCSPDVPEAMYRRAAETNKFIATEVPVKDGRVELIHYLKEQSIAFEYHRYGSGQDKAPRIEEEYK